MKLLNLLTIISILISCGAEYSPQEEQLEDYSETKQAPTITPADDFTEEEREWGEEPSEDLMIRGYISPYEILVDEKPYTDSEDFYTSLLNKLEEEKTASGYEDYKLTLNAEIGLKDLKRGMTVSVVADGDQGYSGEDVVDWEGKFSIKFPKEAEGGIYTIRASKKIDITLTKKNANDVTKWCYNFTASKSIEAKADSKPYIIKTFRTKVTKYKCSTTSYETLGNLSFEQKEQISTATEDLLNGLSEEKKEEEKEEKLEDYPEENENNENNNENQNNKGDK